MPNDLTVNDDHHDKILARRIEAGEITKEEVESVWRQTDYLSPQTPLEVRQAVIALENSGREIGPFEAMMIKNVTDLRAALFRDESKFAHLVAGTETIVKTLQNVNPLEVKMGELSRRMGEIESKFDLVMLKLDAIMENRDQVKIEIHDNSELIDLKDEHLNDAILDPEVEAQASRKGTIGSAWAKS